MARDCLQHGLLLIAIISLSWRSTTALDNLVLWIIDPHTLHPKPLNMELTKRYSCAEVYFTPEGKWPSRITSLPIKFYHQSSINLFGCLTRWVSLQSIWYTTLIFGFLEVKCSCALTLWGRSLFWEKIKINFSKMVHNLTQASKQLQYKYLTVYTVLLLFSLFLGSSRVIIFKNRCQVCESSLLLVARFLLVHSQITAFYYKVSCGLKLSLFLTGQRIITNFSTRTPFCAESHVL